MSNSPSYEVKTTDKPPLKGFYFVLKNSEGGVEMESNVFDDKDLCRQGADEELKNWIASEKIS